jgi:hypothetical protein
VVQITAIDQLNSRSARIGTSAAVGSPADGDLLVSGVITAGQVVFDNDNNVAGKETGGSERSLAKINTSNFCEYGDVGVNGVEYQTGVFHKFKKNTATFLTIDSSGNVGVSESVPKATVHVKPAGNGWIDGLLLEHNAGNTGWNIHAEDNSTNDLWFGYNSNTSEPIGSQAASAKLKIDSAGNSTFTGKVIAENSTSQQIEIGDGAGSSWDFGRNTTSGSLVIRQNTTEKLAVSSTGLAVTGAVTATTLSTFSAGIAFQSATSSTESGVTASGYTLDKYETGDWTPVNSGSGSSSGTWDTTLTGKYTRVGNLVTVTLKITGTTMDFSGTAGYRTYTGLPFTSSGASGGACRTNHAASFGATASVSGTAFSVIPVETGSGTNQADATATYFV